MNSSDLIARYQTVTLIEPGDDGNHIQNLIINQPSIRKWHAKCEFIVWMFKSQIEIKKRETFSNELSDVVILQDNTKIKNFLETWGIKNINSFEKHLDEWDEIYI